MVQSVLIPTPNIISRSNYFVLQRLFMERVKSIVMGVRFPVSFETFVEAHLDPPRIYRSQNEIESWLKETTREIVHDFKHYEQQPNYQSIITQLKSYEGYRLVSLNANQNGLLVNLTNSNERL